MTAARAIAGAILAVVAAAFTLSAVLAEPQYQCEAGTVIVRQGDTAWGILADRCTGHIGQAVHDHGLGGHLLPGQAITIKGGN